MKLFLISLVFLFILYYLINKNIEKFSDTIGEQPEEPEQPEQPEEPEEPKQPEEPDKPEEPEEEHAEVPKPNKINKTVKPKKPCIKQTINNCCPEYNINVHNIKGTTNVTTPTLKFNL